jgi:hypothetical protein
MLVMIIVFYIGLLIYFFVTKNVRNTIIAFITYELLNYIYAFYYVVLKKNQ